MSRDYLIPAPVDVRTLDLLGAAVAGGFLLAPLSDARRGLERLRDDDMPSGALRFVLGAVRAVVDAGAAPSVPAVTAHIRSTGALPESNLPHIGALLADLASPDVCPAGRGELERIPDVVNAAARRRIRLTAQQALQVLEDCSDAEVRDTVPKLGRDLWRASQRIYAPEVTA